MGKKNIFYVGPEHHKTHLHFIREHVGGEYFITGYNTAQQNTYEAIERLDGKDVIWFFADLYENIIPYLKGKSVFVPHGLGFKPYLTGNISRVKLLKKYITKIWSTGHLEEYKYLKEGIDRNKIEQIGYTLLFDIPKKPMVENSLFVSVGWFRELTCWQNMLRFIKSIPDDISVHVSTHPSMPQEVKNEFLHCIDSRENFICSFEQEDIKKSFSVCSRAIVGFSSVVTPFHFFRKPVIFIKDRNRFPFFQWQRLKFQLRDKLFFDILSESTKILAPSIFDRDLVMNAKLSESAKKIFYESNWDKDLTVSLIDKAMSRL